MTSRQRQKKSKTKLETLKERTLQAEQGGGGERIEKQHGAGKMTARERVEFLVDEDTFEGLARLSCLRCADFALTKHLNRGAGVLGANVLTNGRPGFVFVKDFTVF